MVLMDITGYVEQLRANLHAAAAAGDETMGEAADRLATALDAAVSMAMLEALSDAAAEITSVLDGIVVEVRLKGREPQFVVTVAAHQAPTGPTADAHASNTEREDDALTARITLRLPDALKVRAEEAAGRARQSLNTWLVDAIRTSTSASSAPPERRGPGQHLSGWAR